ncbi:MAG: hydrogenase iron-sulfur subunit [Dehalococcoidales bacterium]|nr:hydrogenase iron-sulfur subunit [Dehalococcoidales bacterium]
MMDVGRHPRIKLLAYSEVEHVSGYVGNFNVKVHKKARYVDEKECNSCGECEKVCPVVKPDEFQMGFSSRRAIYKPFPQAVPSAYVLNEEDCLGTNPIVCGKCQERCEKKCIDYDMQDEVIDLEVGVIVVAVGMDVFDPTHLDEYGYTRYENVITSLEFERLISAGGPTEGHLIRPTDGKVPRKIGFIQCVGSRMEKRGNPYCSNICCMNTIKDSLLLKDHYPDVDVNVFYIDIRAFGKGFEDLYRRSKEEGVRYVRGLPGDIAEDPVTNNLIVTVENTTTGRVERHEMDLVVLSTGATPRTDSDLVQRLLTLSRTSDGFFLEAHPKLRPVDASTKGVFFAGCAEAPKDIKDSVTQASAAAARATIILNSGKIHAEAITSMVDVSKCTACELCTRVCPYRAITSDRRTKTPATVVEAACAGCGSCGAECAFGAITMRHFSDEQIYAQIDAVLVENPGDKMLVFACNWCSYAGADFAGTSRLQYPPTSRVIRTMCSGRVDEKFVIHAFKLGAALVLISGCHYSDCHYIDANRSTQRRVDRLWDKLERKGIRPERLQLEWISAAEGQKFAKTMRELDEMRMAVTAQEIEHTRKVLASERTNRSHVQVS